MLVRCHGNRQLPRKAVPLTMVWGVLVALCLASFIFIFSVMKKLEKVC